ncbi:MAG: tetratricopeptide repeat protein [Armatimonadota bacterium]
MTTPRGLLPVSENVLRAASARRQRYHEFLMRQGHELYRKGWYGPAMGRFRQAALVMPGSAGAHLWMARCAFKMGDYQDAREALGRVFAIAPDGEAAKEARALLEAMR